MDYNHEFSSLADAQASIGASGLPAYVVSFLNAALTAVGPLPGGKHYKVIAQIQTGDKGSVAASVTIS